MDKKNEMNADELIKMLDGYMESGGSYLKAADGKILTDMSSGKSESERTEAAILTDRESFVCPTCADIPNIMSSRPDNE